jgi:nicotinate phosphoribosyltransferase
MNSDIPSIKFVFDKAIKDGFYTANYFLKSQKIASIYYPDTIVLMQFFQRRQTAVVCGISEVIALLKQFATNFSTLKIYALQDGDHIKAGEPVLKIEGRYQDFGFLESLIDGILTRRTCVATSVSEAVTAAYPTPIFSMADRQDDYHTQIGDGYATYIGGITKVSTEAQASSFHGSSSGTVPHALIALAHGDLIKALEAYHTTYPDELLTALVDYTNDCIGESLKVARHFKTLLGAVRLDTSKSLLDEYFKRANLLDKKYYGVAPELVFALRKALDLEGFTYVKIVVSSGFTTKKIKAWKKLGVPVDLYGIGTSFVDNQILGFTGDVVEVDQKPEAKVGRHNVTSSRLKLI